MDRPLIVACLRHADPRVWVDPLTGRVDRDRRGTGAAPGEWAALELALQIGQAWNGEVLAVCAGPPDAERTLREAVAVGARALRVVPTSSAVEEPLEPLDRYLDELAGSGAATAAALAQAIRSLGEPALVICADRSTDRGTGSLPAFLAAEFDAAQALGLVRVEIGAAGLVGERRLDRGLRERLRIPRPAVISLVPSGVRLRRAGLPQALAARGAPVPVFAADVAGRPLHRGPARPLRPRTHVVPPPVGGSARERLLALTGALEERVPPTVLRPGSPAEAVDLLLEHLRRNGFVAGTKADGVGFDQPGATGQGGGGRRETGAGSS
jgi:electron transfer flavoprotein beta subunit